jgi:Acetyltransferase (GNAT) domain
MSGAWHRAWADASPRAELAATETLLLIDAAGGVQALLPLLLRRLSFHRLAVTAITWAIGDLGCPDHLDLPAKAGTDLDAFAPVLEALPWDVLILSNLAPNATNALRVCQALAARGHRLQRRALWGCPYLELGDDWERYLATLPPTRRQTMRRKERNLLRHHDVALTDYDGDRVGEGWRHLVTLHERRWAEAGGGAFRDASVRRLHRRFAAELAARGQLWLTTLDLDGAPAAAWYGFTWGDTVYFYQSGRDPRWERDSVGVILMGAMIRRAIERGYRRFDFLRGEDAYKRHWTEAQRRTEEVTIFRRGWRGWGLRLVDAVAELRARLRARRTRAGSGDTTTDG